MPRKWQETVIPFEPLKENKFYPVKVKNINKSKNGKQIIVTLEHIHDEEQLGRTHEISLKLPIRPKGLTADFFSASGMEVRINQKFTPTAAIGSKIMVQFSLEPDGENYCADAFQPLSTKKPVPEEQDDTTSQNRLNL